MATKPSRSNRRRWPLQPSQEFFLACFRDDEPPTIHVELRVAGSLDEQRLRNALFAALAVHPKARARLATPRFLLRPPCWEIVEPEAIDPARILDVIACEDDSKLAAIRSEFCSRPLDLSEAPALRARLVRRPGGDTFLVSVHHAITDGIGALRLVGSITRAYSGQADPVPEDIDPLSSQDSTLPVTPEHRRPKTARLTRLASGDVGGDPGFGISLLSLSREDCSRLDPRPFGPDASLNDLLLAALHLAIARWNSDRGVAVDGIATRIPVNLRPTDRNNEVVGNLSVVSTHSTSPADRASAESLMRSVTAHTRRLKAALGSARRPRPRWRAWAVDRLAVPLVLLLARFRPPKMPPNTRMLVSNLGRIERKLPGFGPDAGAILEFWSSPPIAKPMAMGIVTSIFRGRLQLALRYRLAVLDAPSADAFARLYLDELLRLGRRESNSESSPRREQVSD